MNVPVVTEVALRIVIILTVATIAVVIKDCRFHQTTDPVMVSKSLSLKHVM